MSGDGSDIPLFPLHTVLFPGGLLRLRIFETRYLDMVRRCLSAGTPFGVCLIRTGREVGAAADAFDIGTEGRIVDFATLPGGLLGISVRGGRRFRVRARTVQPDQLLMARVDWLREPPAEGAAIPPVLKALMAAARQAGVAPEPGQADDPLWFSYRAGELLPLPMETRQALLEMDEVGRRMDLLAELALRLAAPAPPGERA